MEGGCVTRRLLPSSPGTIRYERRAEGWWSVRDKLAGRRAPLPTTGPPLSLLLGTLAAISSPLDCSRASTIAAGSVETNSWYPSLISYVVAIFLPPPPRGHNFPTYVAVVELLIRVEVDKRSHVAVVAAKR